MLTYRGYVGTYELDTDDNMFYGKLVGINQLVTFESDTASGLQQAFHESVDDYLAFCAEKGIVADKPFKGSFNVWVSSELHRKAVLASRDSSLNAFVGEAIAEKLQRLETAV